MLRRDFTRNHPTLRAHDHYNTEHAKRSIVGNFQRGLIAPHIAIRQLREAGCCEPEIVEVVR